VWGDGLYISGVGVLVYDGSVAYDTGSAVQILMFGAEQVLDAKTSFTRELPFRETRSWLRCNVDRVDRPQMCVKGDQLAD